MNISDIESYIRLQKVWELFAKSVFDYIYCNHQNILEYGEDSTYDGFDISKDWFTIKYNNSSCKCKESSGLDFLWENIYNGSWKESLEEFENLNSSKL